MKTSSRTVMDYMQELANVDPRGIGRLRRRFQIAEGTPDEILLELAGLIRTIWGSPVERRKQGIVKILTLILKMTFTTPIGDLQNEGAPWLANTFEVLLDSVKLVEKMAVCENPECATPYYFSKRNGQKLCGSDVCVGWAQRQAKAKWWASHGIEWRHERAKQKGGKK